MIPRTEQNRTGERRLAFERTRSAWWTNSAATALVLSVLARASGQTCPPEQDPPRLWRVHQISAAPVEVSLGGTTTTVPLFNKPFGKSGPCTLAINDQGIIVGTYIKVVGAQRIPRPFVWLPNAMYGLSQGFNDLLGLIPGTAPDEPGYANDISDTGLIVGGRGGELETNPLIAFGWFLPDYPLATFIKPLDSPTNTAVSWTMATAVEKFTTFGQPQIVGIAGDPACPEYWGPARFSLTSGVATLVTGLPQPPDPDVSTAPNQSLRQHFTDVAYDEIEVLDYDGPAKQILGGGACLEPIDVAGDCAFEFVVGAQLRPGVGFSWLRIANYNYPPPLPPDPVPDPVSQRMTSARAVASDALVGGCIMKRIGFDNCSVHPAVWTDPQPDETPEDQPNLPRPRFTLPDGPILEEAQVEAVGEPTGCGSRRLAGWESFSGGGAIWDACDTEAVPPDWCTYLIDNLVVNPARHTFQCYDINSGGRLVAVVEDCAGQRYVGMIGPRSDLDFNLSVGASDLAILLGGWSPPLPYQPTACEVVDADIDGDVRVDADDLAILLGDWANQATMTWPCSGIGCALFSQESAAPSNQANALGMAVAALGFESPTAFSEWCQSADPMQVIGACELPLELLSEGGADQ